MADSLIDDNLDQGNANERDAILAKWKDKPIEELLNAKVESDLYIKTLTARQDDLRKDYLALREEAQAKASLQDLIDRHEKSLTSNEPTPNTNQGIDQPSFKPEDIEALLEQKLTQREATNKQTENFNMVKAKLRDQFGDNASAVLKQRMDTLGLEQSFVDELAKKHPTVFFKTFGLDEQRQDNTFQTPPRGNPRQTSFAPVTPKRDWNYYQELKKKDPYIYLDPKIAIQMHDDAIALGDAFGMPKD